ncbi:MAG: acyltransferase, partial [Chthonomonadaceae bacterium]|nr:acyltransferase [Chthonomonadaceae bacterium]
MSIAPLPQTQTEPSSRDTALDVFRGILCISVVLIHVFGAMMTLSVQGSNAWNWLAAANPILLYAVPGFLMLTCLLTIGKLLKPYSLRDYTVKRVTGILIPYLIWSLFYILLVSLKPPPNFDLKDALLKVTYGKSIGHLYYLGLAIQLSVLLVLIAPLFKRKVSVFTLLGVTIVLTLGFYWLNWFVLHLPYVGSVTLWYIPTIAVGLWLGRDKALLPERLKSASPFLLAVAGTALYFYLPLALRVLAKKEVNTFYFQIAEWTYTTTVAVLLIFVSRFIAHTFAGKPLAWIGNYSLQIYLAHPLFLNLALIMFHPKNAL